MDAALVVRTALAVYRGSVGLEDEAVIASLRAAGMDLRTATRVVEFVPLAFIRVWLEGSGAQLPDTYARMRADGKPGPEQPLSSEPIYVAAWELARAGVSREDMLAVAGRSAELDALNQALHADSRLEDLAFAPPHLLWTEEGLPPETPRKPWWKVW